MPRKQNMEDLYDFVPSSDNREPFETKNSYTKYCFIILCIMLFFMIGTFSYVVLKGVPVVIIR